MTTPARFFSPIETSRRLGVSVAALRLYERRGLVRPQRTGAGWRVYGPDELARLHQVLALKSLGLPLARIAELLAGKEGRLDAVLAVQEEALGQRVAELERALQSIRDARGRLAADQALSLDDLATLARETRMITTIEPEDWRRDFEPIWRKHLSDEGYEKFFAVTPQDLAALGLDAAGYQQAWTAVFADARRAMAAGDPRSAQAREVVARWMKLQSVYLKDDLELAAQAMLAQSEAMQDPHLARRMPVDAELLAFVNEVAVKHDLSPVSLDLPQPRPVADDADRPTRAVVRRAVENLQKGEPKYDRMTPELAAVARPQTAMFQQVIRSLGALRTLEFEGVSEIGDVYRLTFQEGVLRCTIRLNAEGLIETIVWQGA